MAEKIIKGAFRVLSDNTQGLSSHSLSKIWAMRRYEASSHDLLIVRDGLGHRTAPNQPPDRWSQFTPDWMLSRMREFPQFGRRRNSVGRESEVNESGDFVA